MLAGLGLLGPVPAADASVTIGPDHIVVATPGARAIVQRAPFEVAYTDGGGRMALRGITNEEPPPLVVPPVPDPQPLGFDQLDGPALYAPLAFTVGVSENVLFPGAVWTANQLAGIEAGVQFSARAVTAVRRRGPGVELEISTNDPTGRTIRAYLGPRGRGAVTLRATVTPGAGVAALGDSFASPAGESFRGFGGRHNALDQRGNDFFNWVQQQNVGAGPFAPGVEPLPGSGGDTYLFPNGPAAAYYVQSQFISDHGYGFLLDNDELSGWRMASDRDDAWRVAVAGPEIEYVVAPGEPREAITTTTRLGGRQPVPPRWALAPQLDRLVKFTGHDPESYLADVRSDLRELRRTRTPIGAYRIEAWHWLPRAVLKRIIRLLERRGIHTLLYFRAFVGKDDIGTDAPRYYDEALDKGYVATTATGDPYLFVGNFNNLTAMIDYTDPEALRWWKERIREALRLGADGFMQDFGEQVQVDMRFANGETGETMHNRLPVLFHRATRSAVNGFERRHPDRRIFFFTRAGYSGTPGSAAYEGGNFPGDATTDWSRSSGLASLATDMLNRGVGGAFGYGADVGGYFDFHTPPTTRELFIRWAQWSALSPLMRLHGSINAGTHTPWSYGPDVVRIYRGLSKLHLAAGPLIMDLWRRGERTGMPIARPMWLAYPNDPQAANQDQQWMLGPDVLVAPVVAEGARERTLYLPRGCWRRQRGVVDPRPGRAFVGPVEVTVPAPLTSLPFFFRCGTRPF